MTHRFQTEFCLRNYRSYFLIRNLSLSLTANSVTQARHKKHFFLFFLSLSQFSPYFLTLRKKGTNISNGTTLWSVSVQQTPQGQGFFKVRYVVTAAGQDQSGLQPHWNPLPHGFPHQRERCPSCSSQGRCWTCSLLLHLRPSSPLNASFSLCLGPFSWINSLAIF